MHNYDIETFKLTKIFKKKTGKVTAVNSINMKVKQGEVILIKGANGSGKTTLLKIISTLITPDFGRASVMGFDTVTGGKYVRKNTGYTGSDERSFYWKLTGMQNLVFFSSLRELGGGIIHERAGMLAELLMLKKYMDEPVENYSAGMKQKLSIIRALIHEPRVILMDEPFKSLDMRASQALVKYIKKEVKNKERTFLIAVQSGSDIKGIRTRSIELENN